MPQAGFLFAIAGLGVSLAGFSGLVLAFRRGAPLQALDAFRLRQIPEMALAVAFLSLATIPLVDAIGNAQPAIEAACGAGVLFTLFYIVRLVVRARAANIAQPALTNALAGSIDLLVLFTGAIGLASGSAAVYEWLLVFMLARPALAFVFVLGEVMAA